MTREYDADVIVIGSGFGGSVAALRFAEAGQSVVVLERGAWIEREGHHIDMDWFWLPHRNRFGMHDIRRRGRNIMPWLGSGVGGGSHVYAGTLKRCESFDGYPPEISEADMSEYFERAETMMGATCYPDYSPYCDCRATQLLFGAGERLQRETPELVEDYGAVQLGVSFAPKDGTPGESFVNEHGATQRYYDPREQALLGGDIDAKNTLDHNYLHLAQKQGATIKPLCQVQELRPLPEGGYAVGFKEWVPEKRWWPRVVRKWFPRRAKTSDQQHEMTARRVVVAAGSIGSTELLLQNRERLPALSPKLGERYTTNGDCLSLILPFRGIFVAWLAFIAMVYGLAVGSWLTTGIAGAVYVVQLLLSRKAFDPDLGSTNSDYVRFRGMDGESQGIYIETGRYPTPLRLTASVLLSILGLYTPGRYRKIVRVTHWLSFIPPLGLLARSWPIPLLKMGKDRAYGRFELDEKGEAIIDFDVEANREFYAHVDALGKRVAKASKAWWIPNLLFRIFKTMEIPHNQGGVAMAATASDGVVDHAGRVFGCENLMVLDGAILPESPGPNPALTILAVAERSMEVVCAQLEADGRIGAAEIEAATATADTADAASLDPRG